MCAVYNKLSNKCLDTSNKCLNTLNKCINTSNKYVNTLNKCINTSNKRVNTLNKCLNTLKFCNCRILFAMAETKNFTRPRLRMLRLGYI